MVTQFVVRVPVTVYVYIYKVSVIAVLTPPRWLCGKLKRRTSKRAQIRSTSQRQRDAQKQKPVQGRRPNAALKVQHLQVTLEY